MIGIGRDSSAGNLLRLSSGLGRASTAVFYLSELVRMALAINLVAEEMNSCDQNRKRLKIGIQVTIAHELAREAWMES